MAKFRRPSRLFRRLSSRGGESASHSQGPASPPSTPGNSTPVSSPPPKLPSSSVFAQRGVRKSRSLPKLRKKFAAATNPDPDVPVPEILVEQPAGASSAPAAEGDLQSRRSGSETLGDGRSQYQGAEGDKSPVVGAEELKLDAVESLRRQPVLVVSQATPDAVEEVSRAELESVDTSQEPTPEEDDEDEFQADTASHHFLPVQFAKEPFSHSHSKTTSTTLSPKTLKKLGVETNGHVRSPSIVDKANVKLVKTLLDSPFKAEDSQPSTAHTDAPPKQILAPALNSISAMVQRKIWVKRPGASATQVQIGEDDLVDDVRDMILRKYANSLGKTFDSPDMTLSIAARAEHGGHRTERLLGPEEEMCRTIDAHYPGGQTVDDALIINVPQRRTPRASPRVFAHPNYHAMDEFRPLENGTDYFPPMPALVPATIPQTSSSHESRSSQQQQQQQLQPQHHASAPTETHPRSISVLNTGQIPPLPSPGAASRRHHNRPKYLRQPTSSPTILSHPNASVIAGNPPQLQSTQPHMTHRQSNRPRLDSSTAEAHAANGIAPVPPPLPTPPAPEASSTNKNNSNPPTPSGTSTTSHTLPHRPTQRPRKSRKPTPEDRAASRTRNGNKNADGNGLSATSILDSAAIPPINVLIVEDNIINLRILEGLMKRLKVRWQTAMNGQIAVDKWKTGGFHLVLMDIQMPVMNGLQAAKEIRRLERVNGIGVFGELESPHAGKNESGHATTNGDPDSQGKAKSVEDDKLQMAQGFFKSPIIIVALTASSLQSDRHEALAAGCNDFLTKPVNFVWLERKVKEWGCMQALIDYDGWRKWKDYAAEQEKGKTEEEKKKDREKEEKDKIKAEKMAKLQEKQAKLKEEREQKKRQSFTASDTGAAAPAPAGGKGEDGGATPTADKPEKLEKLKSGSEVLEDCNFQLG